MEAVGTVTGSLVDETDALLVAHGECFAHAVFHLERNVVNATSAVVEELLNGAFGACGLEEFEFHLADFQKSGLDLLVFYNFSFVHFQSEDVAEVGQYLVDALHRDAQMFNA